MKYTICSVDRAIDFLLPEIKEAKEKGVHFNRPSLLKDVASHYFMLIIHDSDYQLSLSLPQQTALWIVSDALKDLHTDGRMTEGSLIWWPPVS